MGGVFWSDRGDLYTSGVMFDEFGLRSSALDRLALIVGGADTARLDLAPQDAGLLAASLEPRRRRGNAHLVEPAATKTACPSEGVVS
jgi:hypothetical protein